MEVLLVQKVNVPPNVCQIPGKRKSELLAIGEIATGPGKIETPFCVCIFRHLTDVVAKSSFRVPVQIYMGPVVTSTTSA